MYKRQPLYRPKSSYALYQNTRVPRVIISLRIIHRCSLAPEDIPDGEWGLFDQEGGNGQEGRHYPPRHPQEDNQEKR